MAKKKTSAEIQAEADALAARAKELRNAARREKRAEQKRAAEAKAAHDRALADELLACIRRFACDAADDELVALLEEVAQCHTGDNRPLLAALLANVRKQRTTASREGAVEG